MEDQVVVLNPIGRVGAPDSRIAPRLQDLNTKVVGMIDNQKENADIVLVTLRDHLSSLYNFKEILYFTKESAAEPANFLDEIAAKCDCVINGVGH